MLTPRKLLRLTGTALRHGGADLRLARRAIRERGAMQRTWELASLVGVVRDIRPRTVLEIGTFKGGTLACWAETATEDAHLVCIDRLEDTFGIVQTEAHVAHLRQLIKPRQRLTFLPMDSQDAATVEAVQEALAGAAVDFLWIDGDHRDAAVRRDYALYSRLVAPGGTIAFHDIHPDPAFPNNQSHHLWRELRQTQPVREFIDQDHPGGTGMGIGVFQVARH
jgi:predicted O-methyltransferase YrrM